MSVGLYGVLNFEAYFVDRHVLNSSLQVDRVLVVTFIHGEKIDMPNKTCGMFGELEKRTIGHENFRSGLQETRCNILSGYP